MVLKLHPKINPNINHFSDRALISARVQRSFTINDNRVRLTAAKIFQLLSCWEEGCFLEERLTFSIG